LEPCASKAECDCIDEGHLRFLSRMQAIVHGETHSQRMVALLVDGMRFGAKKPRARARSATTRAR